jgi:hypothetical protein
MGCLWGAEREKSKSHLAYGLLEALNSRRLTLYAESANPVTSDARRERLSKCSVAEYEVHTHQAMTFFVPGHRGHDDHLNALALLVQATKVAALRSATSRRHSTYRTPEVEGITQRQMSRSPGSATFAHSRSMSCSRLSLRSL